jgi:hypothetical protein
LREEFIRFDKYLSSPLTRGERGYEEEAFGNYFKAMEKVLISNLIITWR